MQRVKIRQYLADNAQEKFVEALRKIFTNSKGSLDSQKVLDTIGVERTTFFRWSKGDSRVPIERAIKICQKVGLDPSEFVAANDVDRSSMLLPYTRAFQMLDMHDVFWRAKRFNSAFTCVVAIASALQEALRDNDIQTDLNASCGISGNMVKLSIKAKTGEPSGVVSFSNTSGKIVARIHRGTSQAAADVHMGKRAFLEMIQICLQLDRTHRQHNKFLIHSLERQGIRTIEKAK
jgi:DNA-binding XRE family transcriptional regulator